ncbi:hypothetical protein, partial [Micromonospora sp. NPDC047730]|uniref:hypothetical protein n=1 Tax=Micromonospora sp. NPDC047730 TaxID=3364253 RepID=UPI003714ADA5
AAASRQHAACRTAGLSRRQSTHCEERLTDLDMTAHGATRHRADSYSRLLPLSSAEQYCADRRVGGVFTTHTPDFRQRGMAVYSAVR